MHFKELVHIHLWKTDLSIHVSIHPTIHPSREKALGDAEVAVAPRPLLSARYPVLGPSIKPPFCCHIICLFHILWHSIP